MGEEICLGTGTLVNLTDGGDGNYNFSSETIEKIAASKRGKKLSPGHREKSRKARLGFKASVDTRLKQSNNSGTRGRFSTLHPNSKQVFQYDISGKFLKIWDCIMDIQRQLGINNARISEACSKNHYSHGNYWFYSYQGETVLTKKYKEVIND